MIDNAGDVAALGGSRPAETGPAETGPGANATGPVGGGKAVPDDITLMDSGGTLGDTGSLDDAGLNSGTSLEEDGVTTRPSAAPSDSDGSLGDADAPTGGLSGAGTIGGSPTGSAASGFGDKGLSG